MQKHKKRGTVYYLIGVDEAGRGPLAGPVSVGVVAFRRTTHNQQPTKILKGIRDSKKFSENQREEWFRKLKQLEKEGKIKTAVSYSSAKIIDGNGIVFAIRRALAMSLKKLKLQPNECEVLLDGTLYAPKEYKKQKTIIRGDNSVPIIAAASIIAKVSRDRKMKRMAKKFPKYGFEIHKGYGTKAHYRAIKKLGVSEIHRRSFLNSKNRN